MCNGKLLLILTAVYKLTIQSHNATALERTHRDKINSAHTAESPYH